MKKELEELFKAIDSLGNSAMANLVDESYLYVAYYLAKLEDGIADLKKELEKEDEPTWQSYSNTITVKKETDQPSGLERAAAFKESMKKEQIIE